MKITTVDVKSYAKTTLKHVFIIQESDILTVVLPGMMYSIWGPSLYYATNLSLELGFDTLLVEYGYQKTNIDFKEENYEDILNETYEAIEKTLRPRKYKYIVIIGKSFGTSITSHFIEKLEKNYEVISVLLTPTQKALEVIKDRKTLVIVGDNDSIVSIEDIEDLKRVHNIEIHVIHGADHGLDVATVENSINEMKIINRVLKEYLIKATS